jgi:hypothetical protein
MDHGPWEFQCLSVFDRGDQRNRFYTSLSFTYSANKMAGQWKAHGRYIARESATHETSRGHEGFG